MKKKIFIATENSNKGTSLRFDRLFKRATIFLFLFFGGLLEDA